jgi:hypothetical protein
MNVPTGRVKVADHLLELPLLNGELLGIESLGVLVRHRRKKLKNSLRAF